ncbi:hypothetical protein SMICM17S_06591 [Streptomyces microflavus]
MPVRRTGASIAASSSDTTEVEVPSAFRRPKRQNPVGTCLSSSVSSSRTVLWPVTSYQSPHDEPSAVRWPRTCPM